MTSIDDESTHPMRWAIGCGRAEMVDRSHGSSDKKALLLSWLVGKAEVG